MLYLSISILTSGLLLTIILGLKMQSNERAAFLRHMEAQKVVGGLPPDQWEKQLALEARRVGIEETKLKLAEQKFLRDQGKEDELFKIELEQKRVTLKRAEAAAERDGLKSGGRSVFGS